MKPKPKQTDRLELRLTDAEREAYERAAEADSRTLSNWVRLVLNKAASAHIVHTTSYAKPSR